MRIAYFVAILLTSALALTACEGLVDILPGLTARHDPPLAPLPPPAAPTAYALKVVEVDDAGADSGKPTHVAQQLAALERLSKDFASPIRYAASYSETGAIAVYEGSTHSEATGGGPIEANQKTRLAGLEGATLTFGRVLQSEKDNVAAAEWLISGTREKKPFTSTGASVFYFDDDGVVNKEDRYVAAPHAAAVDPPLDARASKGTHGEEKVLDQTSDLLSALDAANDKALDVALSDETVLVDSARGKELSGKRDILAFAAGRHAKIADTRQALPMLLAVDDVGVAEIVTSGTAKKPTGSTKVELHGLGIVEWADGKAKRIWLFEQPFQPNAP